MNRRGFLQRVGLGAVVSALIDWGVVPKFAVRLGTAEAAVTPEPRRDELPDGAVYGRSPSWQYIRNVNFLHLLHEIGKALPGWTVEGNSSDESALFWRIQVFRGPSILTNTIDRRDLLDKKMRRNYVKWFVASSKRHR